MTADQVMASLERQAARIGFLQAEVKRMSQTYQRTAKETVAAHYGLPFDQVDLPYDEWAALRQRYETETGKHL